MNNTGKSSQLFQTPGRNVDVMMIGAAEQLPREYVKALVDQVWNRGVQDAKKSKKVPSWRGRLGRNTEAGIQTDMWWVYHHGKPSPVLLITSNEHEAQEMWKVITSGGGKTFKTPWKMTHIDDLLRQSEEARRAEASDFLN